jgi:hypothetical protein
MSCPTPEKETARERGRERAEDKRRRMVPTWVTSSTRPACMPVCPCTRGQRRTGGWMDMDAGSRAVLAGRTVHRHHNRCCCCFFFLSGHAACVDHLSLHACIANVCVRFGWMSERRATPKASKQASMHACYSSLMEKKEPTPHPSCTNCYVQSNACIYGRHGCNATSIGLK